MKKFYIIMIPANTLGVAHDVFYTAATSYGSTDFIEEATRFESEPYAQDRRSELNKIWRCCAQIRAVEIIPPVEQQFKLLPAGQY